VILEADQGCRVQVGQVCVDDNVADESFLAGFSANVDEADAGEALALCGLVVVAEELVAAADRQYLRTCVRRSLERRLLVLQEVFIDEGLFSVLAAAEEKDVDLVHSFSRAAA